MIVRYHVKCDHCDKITLLRIGIGFQSEQDFELQCEGCSQEIAGRLHLDQDKGEVKGLDVNSAKEVDADQHDFMFTFHPDFPSAPGAANDPHVNPFLAAFQRYGTSIQERDRRSATLQLTARDYGAYVGRIIRNYKSERWDLFRSDVFEILPDNWPLGDEIDRNGALYQIVELLLMPVITCQSHVDTIEGLAEFVGVAARDNRTAFTEFIAKADRKETT